MAKILSRNINAGSIGLVTSGKPALAPHLPDFWNLTRRIGLEAPKVEKPVLFGG